MNRDMPKDTNSSPIKISITGQVNATWQGTITRADTGETVVFRSVMELMKLIDAVLNKKDS